MIRAALGLELRTLVRSPLRMLVLILTLATGIFVLVQGQRDVGRWQEAIEAARAEQEESLAEARAFFAADQLGPEDRPWVDLSQARWQDWYAATRLVREPASLAGIAFASPEAGAVAVRINRFANPLLAQGARIENPELVAAGGLDLVTVLALLLPLMLLAMGVEVGGHERASGILPLVRVQSGRDRSWLCARCMAVGIIGATTGLALVAVASIAGGAELGDGLAFGGLVLAYVALWTALLAAVALVARHPSQGAVLLGAAWITLCVLVPAIGVERAAALAADDFGLDLTVEARDAGQALDELEEEDLFAALLQRFPDLQDHVPEDRSAGSRTARDGLRSIALEERVTRREQLGQEQASLVQLMSIASPAVAFTRALERLAGRDPEAAREYRRAVVSAAADRMQRYIASTWSSIPLGVEDFEETHAATPESMEARVSLPASQLVILAAWALALAGLAGFLSRPTAQRGTAAGIQRAVGALPQQRAASVSRSAR